MLVAAGQAHHIPPMILFAIAYQESGWRQFDANGNPVTNPNNGGVGIMQITGSTAAGFDANQLRTSITYNIEAGAEVLEGKWGTTPVIGDGNGNVGREKLENWYYAIWAYNSWGFINNPNYINAAKPYTAHNPVYQDLIYNWIANCPASLAGMWSNCILSKPSNAQIGSVTSAAGLVGCGQPIPTTPSPYHSDTNFDGVIDGDTGTGADIYVDGSNGASGQNGSMGNPYNTVTAAVNVANAAQAVTIHVKPGTYHESLTINKNIHIVTWGSGTVTIGG